MEQLQFAKAAEFHYIFLLKRRYHFTSRVTLLLVCNAERDLRTKIAGS